MSRLQIPYDRVLLNPSDFDPDQFDPILRRFIAASSTTPVILEVFNDYSQSLLFIRDGQLYWAGTRGPEGFENISIRNFFKVLYRTQFPKLVVYEVNLLLYHSLLIYLQKKPDLKVSSGLVDLDDLLDRTEAEHVNALVTALQPGNLVMLRYKDGRPAACYHGFNSKKSEVNRREEFLVKVYTMSAHAVFEINLFSDLVVTHAEDAKTVPGDYSGSVASYFMSQPPKLIVKLKNRPLKTYSFTGKQLTIGRLPDNDIIIDNLSVSRKHAVIHSWKSGYHIKDLGSKNSTFLNGDKVDTAELKNGDVISIGKYQISFVIESCESAPADNMDQTIIIPNFRPREKAADGPGGVTAAEKKNTIPRLYRRSDHEEFPLDGERIVIGKGKDNDIRLGGLFAPNVTVEIQKSGEDYILQKTDGRKPISINGEDLCEKVLEEEDLIAIGSEEFVFKT